MPDAEERKWGLEPKVWFDFHHILKLCDPGEIPLGLSELIVTGETHNASHAT